MDAINAERINKLAQSLKELHLAATMDEAIKRAEEILGKSLPKEEKTLNDLMKKDDESTRVEEIFIGDPPKDSQAAHEDISPNNAV